MSSSPRAALEEGVAWCEATLGVDARPRRQARADGHAQPPARPRRRRPSAHVPRDHRHRSRGAAAGARALVRPRLAGAAGRIAVAPRLVHWVARCNDVDRAIAALRAAGHDPGEAIAAERMTAHGLLRWRISVRDDGRRPAAARCRSDRMGRGASLRPPAGERRLGRAHRPRRRRPGRGGDARRVDGGRGIAAAIGLARHAARARRAGRRLAWRRRQAPGRHSLR